MPLHILTICDTRSFGTYLCEVLTARGHTASSAPVGKEAFRAVREERPDLIIVEVEAARIDGLVSEHRLQTPDGPRNIPVIVISDCQKLGAELLHIFDFLPKPLDLNRLLDDVAAISARPATTKSHAVLSDQSYQEFASHILSCTGLHFESRNRTGLERGLQKRMSVLRLDSYADYLDFLKLHGESRHERQKLLQFLTVGETYFFRYPAHFEALRERLSGAKASERIRIWSAGCSTGEEPYSIAISIMQALPDWRTRDIKILATDINNQSIKRARDGVYPPWSMRTTDRRCQERYFDQVGQSFLIKDEVKRLVEFSHLNLSCDCAGEICPELMGLDAIFCRNVMIYFTPETAARMVGKFADALKPSGQLFLGHAETLLQRSPDLEVRRQEDSFYYCKVARSKAGFPPASTPSQQVPLAHAPPSHEGPAPSRAARLARAQQQFDAENFNAAEELLAALLREFPDETGALLLKGFLLAGSGRFQEALGICRRVLGRNDLLAEAYFLKGVVLDLSDHPTEAADEYRKALLLDNDFIMPRYHMGRLHLRLGREVEAAREIRNSIRILSKHDDEGTVPYSGGLTRAVCMVQLQNALAQVA
ncbi:MAG TPA: CheR family methyltransferase [Geomonas sp.]